MLGLQAHAYETRGEVLESRNTGEDAQRERKLYWGWIVEDAVENAMRKYLKSLSIAHGGFTVLLDLL